MRTPKGTDSMPKKRYLYVALFSSPFKIGSFIRAVTKYTYNHAAISLSPKMKYLYSFSRHYKNAPFYGGFTKESILRYRYRGKTALMKVFAIPVSEEQYQAAKKRLVFLSEHSEGFVYNMISAACFPFRVNVRIDRSFTCVEFVLSMLKKYADIPVLKNRDFCSIRELSELLDDYTVYEGSAARYICGTDWSGDTFPEEKGKWFYIKKTALNNARLTYRFFRRKRR